MNQEKTLPKFDLYSVKEVAQILEVTPRTVQNYIALGRIRGQKIGGKWRFTREAIEAFIRGE